MSQLATAITVVPSHRAGGAPRDSAHQLLVSRIGVSLRATQAVLHALQAMGLVTDSGTVLGRSPAGDSVRRQVREEGSHTVALAVIRSGWMADQIRSLRRLLLRRDDGYECGRAAAQTVAPQLIGLLARMPDVNVAGTLVIGSATATELDSVWNETTPQGRLNWQEIEQRRKAIGERAELYSIQLERSAHVGAIDRIRWVSRDDDSFGYDIEVAGLPEESVAVPVAVTRRIEVKGSSGRNVQFFISANEYAVAHRFTDTYEVHFWGEIDIRRDVVREYQTLRRAGYPVIVRNPATALTLPPWTIEPSQYRVTRRRDDGER